MAGVAGDSLTNPLNCMEAAILESGALEVWAWGGRGGGGGKGK